MEGLISGKGSKLYAEVPVPLFGHIIGRKKSERVHPDRKKETVGPVKGRVCLQQGTLEFRAPKESLKISINLRGRLCVHEAKVTREGKGLPPKDQMVETPKIGMP